MELILSFFKEYHAEYNPCSKIIHLYGKVLVKDFMALKRMLKSVTEEVKDIRIN
jgi:hypothetical protein